VYFELVDDVIITCGIYKADAVARPSARAQTQAGSLLPAKLRRHATAPAAGREPQGRTRDPRPDQA
jgi:hypothetical protein